MLLQVILILILQLTLLGKSKSGKEIFLKDIWPSNKEINQTLSLCLTPEMFKERYKKFIKEMITGNQLIILKIQHMIGMILVLI